jgi:hypothetical protein
VVFSTKGDWQTGAEWKDPSLANLLDGHRLATRLDPKRDQVAAILEQAVGPVMHNPTRGNFVRPNAERYGMFLKEWGTIYERFGVPADIGLSQAMLESGFHGTRRSRAGAIGFCQWLTGNWNRLKRLSPNVIEAFNQTTQASYCAAYLTILATRYRSFVPALSEHHSGGTNVGRVLVNGAKLGGDVLTGIARSSRAICGRLRSTATATSTAPTARARPCTPRWCSATRRRWPATGRRFARARFSRCGRRARSRSARSCGAPG